MAVFPVSLLWSRWVMTQFSAAVHAQKKYAEGGDCGSQGGVVLKIFLRTGITGCRPASVALFHRTHRSSLPAGLVIVPAWQAAGGAAHR